MTDDLVERRYLLVKRGLYYGPNNQGYTGMKKQAGRYREVDALGLENTTAIHEDDAGEYAPACWMETKLADKQDRIEAQDKLIEALRAGLERIAVYSPAVTHGWAEHVRNIARNLLASIKEPGA
jgi:hypothetical protein